MSAGLTTLEHRLIYDLAQEKGQKVECVALLYGVQFDEATGRLYRRAQEQQGCRFCYHCVTIEK